MIVAIDGPAGAGKSTVASEVARKRQWQLVDTGAMYRTVALKALEMGIDLQDSEALAQVARDLRFEFRFIDGENTIFCDGEALHQEIRQPRVTRASSVVSTHSEVREALVAKQRQVGRKRESVLEGRDIGTVVFPDAELKLYITATAEERARRRVGQMDEDGGDADYEEVLANIKERDHRDQTREISPLKKADDAVEIDTTSMGIGEVLTEVDRLIEESRGD